MATKILIADDEKDFLEILTYNLKKEGFDVVAVENGEDALSRLSQEPDLIILDIMMPKMDGYEVCQAIRSEGYVVPILFLTARDSDFDEVRAFEIGADDYITKPFSPMTLIARIRSHLRKPRQYQKPKILQIGTITLDMENYTVKVNSDDIPFTKTEFNLLSFLAQRPNRVHSRESLLSNVWGEDTFVVDRTVDVHIGKLRKKLQEYGELIETKPGVGYRLNTQRIENAD